MKCMKWFMPNVKCLSASSTCSFRKEAWHLLCVIFTLKSYFSLLCIPPDCMQRVHYRKSEVNLCINKWKCNIKMIIPSTSRCGKASNSVRPWKAVLTLMRLCGTREQIWSQTNIIFRYKQFIVFIFQDHEMVVTIEHNTVTMRSYRRTG